MGNIQASQDFPIGRASSCGRSSLAKNFRCGWLGQDDPASARRSLPASKVGAPSAIHPQVEGGWHFGNCCGGAENGVTRAKKKAWAKRTNPKIWEIQAPSGKTVLASCGRGEGQNTWASKPGLRSWRDAPARPSRSCLVSGTGVFLEFVGAVDPACRLALHWVPPNTRIPAVGAALLHPRLNLGPRSTFMHDGGSPVSSWRPAGLTTHHPLSP